jgi:hypothetical protein
MIPQTYIPNFDHTSGLKNSFFLLPVLRNHSRGYGGKESVAFRKRKLRNVYEIF